MENGSRTSFKSPTRVPGVIILLTLLTYHLFPFLGGTSVRSDHSSTINASWFARPIEQNDFYRPPRYFWRYSKGKSEKQAIDISLHSTPRDVRGGFGGCFQIYGEVSGVHTTAFGSALRCQKHCLQNLLNFNLRNPFRHSSTSDYDRHSLKQPRA